MRLLSQMNNGQAYSLSAHSSTRGTRADPLCVGYVPDGKVFSLISSLPSSLSADVLSVFVRMIHRYYAAVRLLADVHAGRVAEAFSRRPATHFCCRRLRGLPVLVHEVSRRAWGLRLRRTEQELALSLRFMLPSAHYKGVGVRIASFRSSIAHPAYPLSTLRRFPRGSNARLGAERIASPFS